MAITVRPLSEFVGAEIGGIDLGAPLDDATFKTIEQAWHQAGVILLRDQRIEVEHQLAFAERVGPLQHVRTVANVHEHPAVMLVTNIEMEGRKAILPYGPMQFHSDQCYYETPASATTLYAIEVPLEGGDTLFADCRAAYRSLPAATRARLDGLKARFVYDYGSNATTQEAESDPDAPHFTHPAVRTHPDTGTRALFVNRLMTERLDGVDDSTGRALLDELYAAIERPEFCYTHRWRPGDFVMWDNRSVQHARTDFDPSARRLLQRVTVQGDRPF